MEDGQGSWASSPGSSCLLTFTSRCQKKWRCELLDGDLGEVSVCFHMIPPFGVYLFSILRFNIVIQVSEVPEMCIMKPPRAVSFICNGKLIP